MKYLRLFRFLAIFSFGSEKQLFCRVLKKPACKTERRLGKLL
uniref:Uncharacterized protein n=1 Tax=Gynuella sunshinyii YC6258 TaxID=1445510 RepID=A0A0C5W451_9GAMM|nr:hypothetical Protein YC6258_05369 [Gynuella sunshinyii YC6258]